ncbi:MAG: hypothetical protein ABIP48_31940 [Planctomycetota bacterium]
MGHILGKSDTPLDFDALIDQLRAAIPGMTVKKTDSDADRAARQGEITRQLGTLTSSHPVELAKQTAQGAGLKREIELPLSDSLRLKGTVSRTGILLAADGNFTQEEVRAVLDVLEQYPQLKLKISASR